MSDLVIRPEQPADIPDVAAIVKAAFPTDVEVRLVDALRDAGALSISLLALHDGTACGHIAFSPVTLEGRSNSGIGLAPLSVLPPWQRRGIGAALARAGLDVCRQAGWRYCIVLGEPEYYGRFGFRPASRFGLSSIYDAGDAFMAMELAPGALDGLSGLVRYHAAFDAL